MSERDDIEQARTLKLAAFGWDGRVPRRLHVAPLGAIVVFTPRTSRPLPTGPTFPKAARAHWLLRGRAAIAELTAFVSAWRYTANDDHARGHAADLLVQLGAVEAIPALLDAFTDDGCPDALLLHLYEVLPRFGEALIEPAATLVARDPRRAADVCDRLVATGLRDDRIFDILVRGLETSNHVALSLAAFGDARALPAIRAAVERFDAAIDHPGQLFEIAFLEDAFEELGGVIDEALRQRIIDWNVRKTAAWLAYTRVARDLRHAPPMADPETRALVRQHLPSRAMVMYAEPLLAELDDPLDALDFAYACRRIAVMPDGPKKIVALVRSKRRALARKMIRRYRELFPNGEPD